MKKIILLLFVCSLGYAQEFGNYKVDNTKEMPDKGVLNNQWYKFKNDNNFYIKYFNMTPVGIKTAIEEVKYILSENNLDFKDAKDNSFYSAIVKDIYDYEMLNISIASESSEVSKSWYLNRVNTLLLSLKKGEYQIMIYKP
jgi:hypothetical protein